MGSSVFYLIYSLVYWYWREATRNLNH